MNFALKLLYAIAVLACVSNIAGFAAMAVLFWDANEFWGFFAAVNIALIWLGWGAVFGHYYTKVDWEASAIPQPPSRLWTPSRHGSD